jgi:hypothetical protein
MSINTKRAIMRNMTGIEHNYHWISSNHVHNWSGGVNELWHFWFVEEIFAVPDDWMFNTGVVVAFMGALAYVVLLLSH